MKMLKNLIFILCIVTIIVSGAWAADYDDVIRVGIYYGSGEVESLTAESPDGFTIGYFDGRVFNPICTEAEGKIKVLNNTQASAGGVSSEGAWHVAYGDFQSANEAKIRVNELEDAGIDAFIAYTNGAINVWGGCFKSENDALWAAENLLVKGNTVQSGKSVKAADQNDRIIFLQNDGGEIGISHADYENYDKTISISGAAKGTYRGGFAIKPSNNGGMTVINVLPVEKYLYGVVSREMSASWHIEALKTQAVCARNFALGRINHHKQYGFDVCRTTCCQAYSGTSAEDGNVRRAVDETRGELLMYDGKLCQTVYSSSMGAYTESVENVWGTPFPYLVSVENSYEDTENVYNGKWTKKLTTARVTEIMKNRGYDIGEVLNITALEYTPAGSVLKLRVQGTNGEKIFEREMCRSIFSEATYSQKYTVSKGGVTTYPVLNITNGKKTTTKSMGDGMVLCGDGTTSRSGTYIYISDGGSAKKLEVTSSTGNSDEFVFSGEGWGHGVGMSQYGAKGMAEAGFSYDEILTHYYTGTELTKGY